MLMPAIFGERLFDNFLEDFDLPSWNGAAPGTAHTMKTDIRETEAGYELDIDLPGFKKDDISAQLKNGYLTISATTKSEDKKEENGKYLKRERFYGSMSRSFYVGNHITEEDIKAKFTDGILKLSVPKKQRELPKQSFISIED